MMPMPITVEPTLTHPYRSDHGFGCLETSRGRLPLAALEVEARVTGLEVSTELRQTFVNHTGQAIEATYIFPLPDRAAVHRFRMEVSGRVVEGVIDERGRARETYDNAIAAGQRAAIAEEDRPGVFTLRVGNLVPGDHAIITLSMVGPLPVEDGEVTYAFPLVVAPRYIPGAPLAGDQAGTGTSADTNRVPDASRISPPVLLEGFPSPVRLALAVIIDGAGLPISALRSSLHEVHATPDGAGWRVELRPGERLNRDFILRWTVGDTALRTGAVWAPDEDGEGATAVITLVPPVGAAAMGRARDVVLVLDRSGSMDGWKMVAARRAAARIVDTLGERDRFAVLAFDNSIESPKDLGSQLVAGGDRNRFRAVEFLSSVNARGGTELAEPLELAARLLAGKDDRDRVLVLVTDGQVGNEDEILRRLVPSLGGVRVFTLGIDQAVNAAFLRRLAASGGGACELVESEDRLDEVMAKIHRRVATPVLVDIQMSGEGLDLSTQAPRRLPAVFAGAPLVVRARWRGRPRPGATIELRGRLPAGTEYLERIALDSARPGSAIAQSWARGHIRDLEDQYAVGAHDKARIEQAIVAVSLRHRVLSRFTAFVAVDREVVNPGGNPKVITQPVEHPAGWGEEEATGAGMTRSGVASNVRHSGGFGQGMPRAQASAPMGMPVGGPPGMPGGAPPPPSAKPAAPMKTMAFNIGSSGGSAGAPPAPPAPAQQAPASPKGGGMFRSRKKAESSRDMDDAFAEAKEDSGLDTAPYQARLASLAEDLARAATAVVPGTAAQLPVARLAELLEDLKTVGLDELATKLAPIVDRLRGALVRGDLVATLNEASTALRTLASGGGGGGGGGGSTSPGQPRRKGWAFWR
jgi:Ca-activated chloride channel family protein